jgi:hypothetical protein
MLLVVVAPLIVLALALTTFAIVGPANGTSYILLLHVVLTVAHHMPTFIRIYGDVELFKRFKWAFVCGPCIAFGFALAVLAYLNLRDFPIENVLVLFIFLTLWDPWHFLMQHYGFMRIYDRQNQAPRVLAARMDLLLCASWFVFVMLASGEWLVAVLEDLYLTAHLPVILFVPADLLAVLVQLLFAIASVTTLGYGVYLSWCRRRGYFISVVKLALFATTFGVMFMAYTPNEWILALAPGWTFKVGFAVLGIVHMTQYLAIVWRYNRSLAAQPARARAGLFRSLHARGGWLAGCGYVAVCLLYGALLTSVYENRWLMSLLLATGFTSTLMHYYFDGFIWKMRHRQNSEHLIAAVSAAGPNRHEPGGSWWDLARQRSIAMVALRQCLYFGAPLTVLTVGALWVWNGPGSNYVGHMMRGELAYRQGAVAQSVEEAKSALASMEWQLPAAARLAELQPTAAREAALAFLIYNRSRYVEIVLPMLAGNEPGATELARHRENISQAAALLEQALQDGGPLLSPSRERMNPDDGRRALQSWRSELADLRRTAENSIYISRSQNR